MDFSLYVLVLQEEDGYTGLHHAAKLGNLEILNMLLETGQVDVNAQVKEDPKWPSLSFFLLLMSIYSTNNEARSISRPKLSTETDKSLTSGFP